MSVDIHVSGGQFNFLSAGVKKSCMGVCKGIIGKQQVIIRSIHILLVVLVLESLEEL